MLPLLPFSKSLFVSLIQTPGHTLDTLNQGGPNFSIGVQNGGPPAGDATEKCPHTPFKADNGHFTRVALSPPCGEHGNCKVNRRHRRSVLCQSQAAGHLKPVGGAGPETCLP